MKAAEKRKKILEAAKSCFTQFGYEKTTLDDIGRKLGLNKSSLYYYFKNKEEIFTAVVVKEAEAIVDELQQEFSDRDEPEEKIQVYMKKRLIYYRQVLGLHKLDAESLRQIQPGFHELYATLLQREILFVARELRKIDDQLGARMAESIAEVILSSADAIKHDEIMHNRKGPDAEPDYSRIEQDTELLIRLILHGVRQTVKKYYKQTVV
ncbi:MAG: TetR/AcrR family transcriptional regulator [Bacteroidetes bacterium]|nr:TetR/AcrR family transcriptional regulator [Bacteroidota bacterium]